VVGFDGPVDLQALRLYGLPEAAPAVLNGTPLLSGPLSGSGRRELAAEVSWDLPSLAAGATANVDVTVTGARVGNLAQASLATSSGSSNWTPQSGPTTPSASSRATFRTPPSTSGR
jgi:hypothetical protein